jgi:hypothetical protein
MQFTAPRWIANARLRHQPTNPNFEHSVLPSYGTVYLNQLVGEFESLKGRSVNDCACQLAQQIVDKARSGSDITWGDTYSLEKAVLVMLPDIEVHQRLWCLEARYRDAVGNSTAYDTYIKVDAAHLSPESIEHARARLDNLIHELYRLYTVIACREEMRSKLSKTAMYIAVCLLVVVIVCIGLFRKFDSPLIPFAIVFAAGAIGGAVSFERRVQSLPSRGESLGDLVELSGGSGIYLSPFTGGIFAIVLYLLFAAGLADGVLFPKLGGTAPARSLSEFASNIQPMMTQDWGKLLIWSFIAGFAERFVPDTLDRLIARSEEKKKQAA